MSLEETPPARSASIFPRNPHAREIRVNANPLLLTLHLGTGSGNIFGGRRRRRRIVFVIATAPAIVAVRVPFAPVTTIITTIPTIRVEVAVVFVAIVFVTDVPIPAITGAGVATVTRWTVVVKL